MNTKTGLSRSKSPPYTERRGGDPGPGLPAKKRITPPDWPWREIIRLARTHRVSLWLVGGAVRDLLLGRPVHDWDFVTDSPNNALGLARATADALRGAYYPLDARRGIGRAVVTTPAGDRINLDFTSLRGGSLEDDLLHRDFTVNALAVTPAGELIDLTGGLIDLAAHLLRAPSAHTFREDPIRLLRAVRLEAALGFALEPRTAAWLRSHAPLLGRTSAERIREEWANLLTLPGAAAHTVRLDEFGLLEQIVPELRPLQNCPQSPPHRFDVRQHTLYVLDAIEAVMTAAVGGEPYTHLADVPPSAWQAIRDTLSPFADRLRAHLGNIVGGGHDRALLLKIAALLHDIGKPQTRSQDTAGRIHFYGHETVGARMAAERLNHLRFSRGECQTVRQIIVHHLRPGHLARQHTITRRAVYRYFRATGDTGVEIVLLRLADYLATLGPTLSSPSRQRELSTAMSLLTHYFEHHDEIISPPPLVTGRDLLSELGLRPGPDIGRLLEMAREAQAAGEIHTRAEGLALIRKATEEKMSPK